MTQAASGQAALDGSSKSAKRRRRQVARRGTHIATKRDSAAASGSRRRLERKKQSRLALQRPASNEFRLKRSQCCFRGMPRIPSPIHHGRQMASNSSNKTAPNPCASGAAKLPPPPAVRTPEEPRRRRAYRDERAGPPAARCLLRPRHPVQSKTSDHGPCRRRRKQPRGVERLTESAFYALYHQVHIGGRARRAAL